MISQLKQWFKSLTESEQRLLLFGTILVFIALFWVVVYQPIIKKIDAQAMTKNRLESQLAQMNSWSQQTISNQENNRSVIPQNMTFSSWLDQQLQTVNLQQFVSRTEPIDENSLSVWLQGASFNLVIDWLQDISNRFDVQVDQIDINVVDSDLGLTDIRMRLVK